MAYTEQRCDCRLQVGSFRTGEKFKLLVCFDVNLLATKKTKEVKEEKRRKLEDIIKNVSALRNSNGGSLIVHLAGFSRGTRKMSLINEYLDQALNNLVEDGSPFTTEYFKQWYSDNESEIGYHCLVITVSGSSSVSTADFKTKVALDDCIMRPTSQNMDVYLYHNMTDTQRPRRRGLNVREENRNIQFKSIQAGIFNNKTVPEMIDYIWNRLRLPEYISTFTKQREGGSFYIGISEEGHGSVNGIKMGGLPLPPEQQEMFLHALFDKVREEISWFQSNRWENLVKLNKETIDIIFHPVQGENVIVEIAVGPVNGCVFYDTKGPETYIMTEEGKPERMTFAEWLEAYKKRKLCENCQALLCDHCKRFFIKT